MSTTIDWNPRYLAYCRVNGQAHPDKMLERDRASWPGGHMCGFMLWIQRKWFQWEKATGWKSHWPKGDEQHKSFDTWLEIQQS